MQKIIQQLSAALTKPLPGLEAHAEMSGYKNDERKRLELNPENARLSAVCILLYPSKEDRVESLLIQRSSYKGAHSAQIALPGGKKDPEDDNLIQTAVRELYEEVGIPSSDVNILGKLSPVYVPVSGFKIFPYIGYLDYVPSIIPDPREVERVIRYSPFKLLDDDVMTMRSVQVEYPRMRLKVPSFMIDDNIVWGATAMILNEFKSLLSKLH